MIVTRKVKSVVGRITGFAASVGDNGFERHAATAADAKEACTAAIVAQATYGSTRRYIWRSEGGKPVCFALYYADGWWYDITRPGQSVPSSCGLAATTMDAAFEAMRQHAESSFDALVND